MAAATPPPTFEEFFAAEKDRLLRVLMAITGSTAEAEDLAQEAFTRVLVRWSSVAEMENPTGYLHRTAMNLFRSNYRRAARSMKRAFGADRHEDVFQAIEDRDSLLRALASITPRQRAAIVLTDVLGYSGEETGRLLGIKPATVWVLTHQARSNLRGTVEVSDG